MSEENQTKINRNPQGKFTLSEDWLSVLIAFGLILLAALQIIGSKGIHITF